MQKQIRRTVKQTTCKFSQIAKLATWKVYSAISVRILSKWSKNDTITVTGDQNFQNSGRKKGWEFKNIFHWEHKKS